MHFKKKGSKIFSKGKKISNKFSESLLHITQRMGLHFDFLNTPSWEHSLPVCFHISYISSPISEAVWRLWHRQQRTCSLEYLLYWKFYQFPNCNTVYAQCLYQNFDFHKVLLVVDAFCLESIKEFAYNTPEAESMPYPQLQRWYFPLDFPMSISCLRWSLIHSGFTS